MGASSWERWLRLRPPEGRPPNNSRSRRGSYGVKGRQGSRLNFFAPAPSWSARAVGCAIFLVETSLSRGGLASISGDWFVLLALRVQGVCLRFQTRRLGLEFLSVLQHRHAVAGCRQGIPGPACELRHSTLALCLFS